MVSSNPCDDSSPKQISYDYNERFEFSEKELALYPNPCSDILHIHFPSDEISDFEYIVSDIHGIKIISGTSENNYTAINTHDLSNGIYVLRCIAN